MEFAGRLKELRKRNNLTQKALAEFLDYGATAVTNYESGKNQPSIEDLKRIAKFFGVSVDYLVGVEESFCCSNLNNGTFISIFNEIECKVVDILKISTIDKKEEIYLAVLSYEKEVEMN